MRIIWLCGRPWLVGKDVCSLFGDKNHNRSLSRVDDEDKKIYPIETKGGKQNMTIVNESGLYTLLLGMRPQKANKKGMQDAYPLYLQERIKSLSAFRRWVTHYVLPAIRQKGDYVTVISNLPISNHKYLNMVSDVEFLIHRRDCFH